MVKPSGSIYLQEIENTIKKNSFEISERYYIDDWKTVAEKIYYKNFTDKTVDKTESYEDFLVHAWVNNTLYGNSGILLLLNDLTTSTISQSVRRVFDTKLQIRNLHKETRDGTCLMIVNLKKLNIPLPAHKKNGKIVLLDEKQQIKPFDSLTNDVGRWKGYFLHFVHCPDPTEDDFNIEMNILSKSGVLKKENLIPPENWEILKKLGSCKRL